MAFASRAMLLRSNSVLLLPSDRRQITHLHDEPYLIVLGLPRGSSAIYPVEVRQIRMIGKVAKHAVLLDDQALSLRRELLYLNGHPLVA